MSKRPLGVADYPLAETPPRRGARRRGGLSLDELTLESVMAGDVTLEDLKITPACAAAPGRDRPRRRSADAGGEFRAGGGNGRRAAGLHHADL